MFSYVSPEGLVPRNHPLRSIRPLVNAALQLLSPQFDKIYAPSGLNSIAPERLLRALLLQAPFSVRSEHRRELSQRVRFGHAGGRCQGCGRPHLARLRCLPYGRWFDEAAQSWRNQRGPVQRAGPTWWRRYRCATPASCSPPRTWTAIPATTG